LGAAWAELGLPLVPAAVAIRAVGQRSGRPLGVERRLGSWRRLGAPRPELGLPLAVAVLVPMQLGRADRLQSGHGRLNRPW